MSKCESVPKCKKTSFRFVLKKIKAYMGFFILILNNLFMFVLGLSLVVYI
jgi:hypothetical protein